MIKAVLFDFGGVLTEGGKAGSIRDMFAAAYGVQPEGVKINASVHAAFIGMIGDQEMINTINRLNPTYPPAPLTILTENVEFFKRCAAVYGLADRLRAQGITTGLFSNVFKASAEVLQRDGYYDGFDPLFLSFEHHMQKPERAFYKVAIDTLAVEPSEILFIDDKEECLAPARELGIHTVLAVSPAQIVADVAALIAKENGMEI
jgi:FMN phosphatase YigB (HAD superfamily)